MSDISLLQPRHNYAPETGQGHVYINTSLLTAAARIMEAGGNVVQIEDENMKPFIPESDLIGINLLGPPYIPVARNIIQRISKTQQNARFLLGGQVIDKLTLEEIRIFFGENAVNGNSNAVLARELDLQESDIPDPEQTSLVPAYEQIPDDDMREYLSRESSLYVSQGCRHHCEPCIAEKGQRERYRDIDILENDLSYLVQRAKKLGLESLSFYLSNLDVFQTPRKLMEFAELFESVKQSNPDFALEMRGLATVHHFCKCHEEHPEVIRALTRAGFTTVGFGVDGWGKEDWKEIRKGHNTEKKCFKAVATAADIYGMTPEILMVFGHKSSTPKSLNETVRVVRYMYERFGAIPRPHIVKNILPGTKAWTDPKYQAVREQLYANPGDCQAQDFCCLPSSVSHPDEEDRAITPNIEVACQKMVTLSEKSTDLVYPETSDLDPAQRQENHDKNIGRYDR